MRKGKKRVIAGGMIAIMMAGNILGNISPIIAGETQKGNVTVNESFNNEGLWITEIYQNDVDRSTKNNTREKNGYESINLYASTTDLMEFVEITSTYDKAVVLKVTCGVNWATSATFSLKTKSDNKIISTFTAKDKVHTRTGESRSS